MNTREWIGVVVLAVVVSSCFTMVIYPQFVRYQERQDMEYRRTMARMDPDFQNKLLKMIPLDKPMPWRNMERWLHEATGDTVMIFKMQNVRICPYGGCVDDSYETSYLFERHPTKLGYWKRTE